MDEGADAAEKCVCVEEINGVGASFLTYEVPRPKLKSIQHVPQAGFVVHVRDTCHESTSQSKVGNG